MEYIFWFCVKVNAFQLCGLCFFPSHSVSVWNKGKIQWKIRKRRREVVSDECLRHKKLVQVKRWDGWKIKLLKSSGSKSPQDHVAPSGQCPTWHWCPVSIPATERRKLNGKKDGGWDEMRCEWETMKGWCESKSVFKALKLLFLSSNWGKVYTETLEISSLINDFT